MNQQPAVAGLGGESGPLSEQQQRVHLAQVGDPLVGHLHHLHRIPQRRVQVAQAPVLPGVLLQHGLQWRPQQASRDTLRLLESMNSQTR
jgi:hypothetical protein